MSWFNISYATSLAVVVATMSVAPVYARSAGPNHASRALYWNTVPNGSMSNSQMDVAIAELKAQQINRAHLWVNDQPTSAITCGSTFSYQGWTASGLETFARRLTASGITVTLTMSPAVPTPDYIRSLSSVWEIAKRTGADVEYDLEGAWTRKWGPQNCGANGSRPDLATIEKQLITETRSEVPGVKIGISTTPGHFKDHAALLKLADWVAPQLYELSPTQMRTYVTALEQGYGINAIWPAVRVDCPLEKLIPGIGAANAMAATDLKVKGIAIWGRMELTYADKWLRRTS